MTLVATVADANANSYLLVADADTLAADDLGPEAAGWLAATLADKEGALKRATRELDGYLSTSWAPYASTQALLFPRSVDVTGGVPYIPVKIKRACYQQGIYVLKNAAVLASANTRKARNMASASEPSASYSAGADDGSNVMSPLALHQLSGFRSASPPRGAGSVRSLRVTTGSPYGQ
jgi:hypothetical protein